MAQTSTTLSGAKSHVEDITGTDISFTASGGTNTISSTSTILTGAGKLAIRDLVTVTGTTNNNKTFTIKSVVSTTQAKPYCCKMVGPMRYRHLVKNCRLPG